MSVVKTAALDELAAVFRSIKAVNKPFNEQVAIQNYGYGDQKIYFDLGDYAKWLSPERYGEFRVALDSCIVYKACTDSYYSEGVQVLKPIRAFSGLSVYVPQEIYVWANEAYCKLKIEN